MSFDWPLARLGDYCQKIGSGATPRGGSSVYLDEGPVFLIRSQNIYNEGFKVGGLTYIDEDAADKLKNVIVEADDVLLNIAGDSVARVCLAPEQYLPARVNQHVAIIRPDPKEFDSHFIRYYLIAPAMQSYLLALAGSGATRNALTKGMIEGLEIPKPDINIQREIAEVLSSLDDKIELNREINQTLEQIAQAIFKSWFVDFDPVKAKIKAKQNGQDPERAAMRAISGKTDEELDQLNPEQRQQLTAAVALFPGELEDSELGEIPKGWSVGTINDLCMLNANSWSKKNEPDEVWYVDLANTKNGIIEEIQYYKWKDSPSRARRILKPGDTIVGTVRPGNRSFALIGEGGKQLTASTGFAVLTPKKNEYLEYIYNAATSDSNVDRLAHLADGGAYPAVRPDVVTQMEVVIPSEEILEKFSDITRPMFSHRENHFEQNAVLANCRDALLPKLLTGAVELYVTRDKTEAVA